MRRGRALWSCFVLGALCIYNTLCWGLRPPTPPHSLHPRTSTHALQMYYFPAQDQKKAQGWDTVHYSLTSSQNLSDSLHQCALVWSPVYRIPLMKTGSIHWEGVVLLFHPPTLVMLLGMVSLTFHLLASLQLMQNLSNPEEVKGDGVKGRGNVAIPPSKWSVCHFRLEKWILFKPLLEWERWGANWLWKRGELFRH